jgi:hypothetical protein
MEYMPTDTYIHEHNAVHNAVDNTKTDSTTLLFTKPSAVAGMRLHLSPEDNTYTYNAHVRSMIRLEQAGDRSPSANLNHISARPDRRD